MDRFWRIELGQWLIYCGHAATVSCAVAGRRCPARPDRKPQPRLRSRCFWAYAAVTAAAWLAVSCPSAVMAESQHALVDSDLKFRQKTVTGRLVAKTKRSISVEYESSENSATDMLLPYDAKTTLVRLRDFGELVPGATVKVIYEQAYKDDDTGRAVLVGTVAKEIALIRDAPKNELGSREGGLP